MKARLCPAFVIFTSVIFAEQADIAIVHANIHTVNPAQPAAAAIAIAHGKILAVGRNVSAYIGPKTRVIDARGATVLPGFIDSHGHM